MLGSVLLYKRSKVQESWAPERIIPGVRLIHNTEFNFWMSHDNDKTKQNTFRENFEPFEHIWIEQLELLRAYE